MATPINPATAISSLIRAQVAAPITGLKTSQQATQSLIDQLQKTAAPGKSTDVTQTTSLGASTNLPRGSLVDFYA